MRELKLLPRMEVSDVTVAEPADDAVLAAARELAGGRLPAGVENFCRELSGFSVTWCTADGGSGSIGLVPVQDVFADWEGATWFDTDEQFRPVKPVDLFQPEACIAFWQEPGAQAGDELYFHYLGEEIFPTGRTFPEYLERLLAARGYWYWQYTLCPGGRENPTATRFLERLPQLFPGVDTDQFRPGSAA